ncbi:MAG: (d)CMP kinase [Gammaproteobacteria bacterium]|nr:(d)CMP kinase [Gammaproteobacteria bacterium]
MCSDTISYKVPVVTVDGPSGSGKGTVSQRLAAELGWHFLDSGALYRLLACAARRDGIALDDEPALVALAGRINAEFGFSENGDERVLLDGVDVTRTLRSEETGNAASQVAALPAVRTALLAWQRRYRRPPGLIADGRDMGTVVFPDAAVKIFLEARPEERALRRYNQLKDNGIDASLEEVIEEVRARDERDRTRTAAPLVAAEDACIVDSSDLDVAATVAIILGQIRAKI